MYRHRDSPHKISNLRECAYGRCLVGLKRRFDEVLFVPGNHEAWVNP